MTITIGTWIIPTIITIILTCIMFRPNQGSGACAFELLLRLFWMIPICIVWIIYMGIVIFLKG